MSTTSSETSTRPSLEHRSLPALAIWLALAAVFVGLAFYGQGQGGGSEDVLYEPEFAVAGVVSYAILAGLAVALVHGLVVALPALVFFGVGLAWVRLRSGSIWPSVLAHSAYNGLGLVILA